jgi:[acyl-carrier-protein] S-malonyltransferase
MNLTPPPGRTDLDGEHLTVSERMIVAPAVGVFRPHDVSEGATVAVGDIVGVVEGPGTAEPVRSAFAGTVMGLLAHPGERLRIGQPVAWMRVA